MRTILFTLSLIAAAAAAAAEPSPQVVPVTLVPPASSSQTIVLAGGCFWGVEAVYEHMRGVTKAVSGYAGGTVPNPRYEDVSTGRTGHAESVQVTFDPKVVTAGDILRVFFSVAHDPTQLNRQGPDTGTQYRSAIFYANDAQRALANAYIAELGKSGRYSTPIVTRVDPLGTFYPAEQYHQDFIANNPHNPYVVFNDLPKLRELKRLYPEYYR